MKIKQLIKFLEDYDSNMEIKMLLDNQEAEIEGLTLFEKEGHLCICDAEAMDLFLGDEG